MILLKYAKVFSKEIDWDSPNIPDELLEILRARTVEFIQNGFIITGTEAAGLTTTERSIYKTARDFLLKEQVENASKSIDFSALLNTNEPVKQNSLSADEYLEMGVKKHG